MIPAAFDYFAPTSVQEALSLLKEKGDDAKILAGGHSLLPLLKLRLSNVGSLIDLGRIQGLSYVREANGKIAIGAMTTYRTLEVDGTLKSKCSIIPETVAHIGDPQVRNRGTIGGALAHADPAADLPAPILALGAEVVAVGPNGERTITADDFFVDLLTTSLEPDEIITEVRVPTLAARTGAVYLKFPHPASRYAIVGVAAIVTLGSGGACDQVRVAITGAGAKATRATAVESALQGKEPTAEAIATAAQSASDGIDAMSDIHASAEYRLHLTRVYTRRALEQAVSGAKG